MIGAINMIGAKRFRTNCVFDFDLNPVPKHLKKALDLLNRNFPEAHDKNLEILCNNSGVDDRLFCLLTNYEGQNFCWVQPTKTRSFEPDVEYNRYIYKVNKNRSRIRRTDDIFIGMDCIAEYEDDGYWYRAIVIEKLVDNNWLILFIDYGNFQTTEQSKIGNPIVNSRYDHHLAQPQVLCCRLYNIVPRHPMYRDDIDSHIDRFLLDNPRTFLELKVRNVRQDCVLDCDIFTPRLGEVGYQRYYRRHIGQDAVDAGLATYADHDRAYALPAPINMKCDEDNSNSPTSSEIDMILF